MYHHANYYLSGPGIGWRNGGQGNNYVIHYAPNHYTIKSAMQQIKFSPEKFIVIDEKKDSCNNYSYKKMGQNTEYYHRKAA